MWVEVIKIGVEMVLSNPEGDRGKKMGHGSRGVE